MRRGFSLFRCYDMSISYYQQDTLLLVAADTAEHHIQTSYAILSVYLKGTQKGEKKRGGGGGGGSRLGEGIENWDCTDSSQFPEQQMGVNSI